MDDQPSSTPAPARQLTVVAVPGIPMIRAGDDLGVAIARWTEAAGLALRDGDVIVVAQKIVSKAEGRAVDLEKVTPSPRAMEIALQADKDPRLVELILEESTEILRVRPGVIIVEHRMGIVLANAGIDQSNLDGIADEVLLLPVDPDASAMAIRDGLRQITGHDVAVLIIDSIGRAWRTGTVGTAIGISGMPGLLDLRMRPDLVGRPLQTSELALADEAAAAASLMMGQADEGTPVVLLRGLPYARRPGRARELLRPRAMDLFR